jgi:streptomycin 6-kinase
MEQSFRHIITNTYGAKGKTWLDNLPKLIGECSTIWQLKKLTPYPNLTYNYVLHGWQNNQPIVLKLRCDSNQLKKEIKVLKFFQGPNCVKIIDYKLELGALLMSQLQPGKNLSSLLDIDDRKATHIAAHLLQVLHQEVNTEFKTLAQTLPDFSQNFELLESFLPLARQLKALLLSSSNPYERLLHGDFHHGNILQSQETWCIIDPEGLCGDIGYDLAVFIRNPLTHLISLPNPKLIISQRITDLASLLQYPAHRLWQWTFLQAMVSAYWSLEDNLEISHHLAFLQILNQL